MITTEMLIAVISIVAAFITILTTLYLIRSLRKPKPNTIEMDIMRKYYESQIFELNQKLTMNNERWKDANHLLLNINNTYDPYNEDYRTINSLKFLQRYGIDVNKITVDKKSIFVLIPFLESENLFKAIKQICTDSGFSCSNGTEEYVENIFSYVLKKIVAARIIIACIDGRNPNVYYELGVAQALGKPTILVSKRTEIISNEDTQMIDLKNPNYVVFYNNLKDLKLKIKDMLFKILAD